MVGNKTMSIYLIVCIRSKCIICIFAWIHVLLYGSITPWWAINRTIQLCSSPTPPWILTRWRGLLGCCWFFVRFNKFVSTFYKLSISGLSGSFSMSIWEDGKEYHFLEESAVHVGTNDLASSVSGLRMMSDVRIQVTGNRLVVSMENVQEAHYSQAYPRGGWPYRLVQEGVTDQSSR